jgi:phage terminase large subunit-like protein
MVELTIRTVDRNVSYKAVTASRGKQVRAEPIAALYEQGKVRHAGTFADLEDELAGFSSSGYMGDRSPNRADACIWAISELFPGLTRKQRPAQTEDDEEGQISWMA